MSKAINTRKGGRGEWKLVWNLFRNYALSAPVFNGLCESRHLIICRPHSSNRRKPRGGREPEINDTGGSRREMGCLGGWWQCQGECGRGGGAEVQLRVRSPPNTPLSAQACGKRWGPYWGVLGGEQGRDSPQSHPKSVLPLVPSSQLTAGPIPLGRNAQSRSDTSRQGPLRHCPGPGGEPRD